MAVDKIWNMEHPGKPRDGWEKYVKLSFQQLNETKLNWYQPGKLKQKKQQNKFKLKKKKKKMNMCALSEGSQLKTNPFLSVRFAINLIAWLSLIPNFVVHRKPRLWWSNFNQTDWGFFIQFIYTSGQRYPYIRFSMKNLIIIVIRSKKEQIRKQEAEIARKILEIASLEQFFSPHRPIINSTSNSLCKESFAGRRYTPNFSLWMNAGLQQHAYLKILIIFTQTNEILKNRDVPPFSLIIYFCVRQRTLS